MPDGATAQREAALWATLGVEPPAGLGTAWEDGALVGLEVTDARPFPTEALRRLLAGPDAALVREIVVGPTSRAPAVLELLREAPLPALRSLRLRLWAPGSRRVAPPAVAVAALVAGRAGLERLEVHAGEVELGRLDLPRLAALDLAGVALGGAGLAGLPASRLPTLSTLALALHRGSGDDDDDPLPVLARALRAATFPELRSLAITDHRDGDRACALIAASDLLSALAELDLSRSAAGDRGAAALASAAAAGRAVALRSLALRACRVTPAAAATLAAALPAARVVVSRVAPADAGEEGPPHDL